MELTEYIEKETEGSRFISITGGGGKSSLLKLLGADLRKKGKSVLLTTTTKFQSPEFYDWGCNMVFSNYKELENSLITRPCSILFANRFQPDERKWQAPDLAILKKAADKFDVTISEADGSRNLPVKVHSQRDPVVPSYSDYTIAVMGILALKQSIRDNVFGCDEDGLVDLMFLNRYIQDSQGLLKGGAKLVLINGAEVANKSQLDIIRKANWSGEVKVIMASIKENKVIEIVR